MKPRAHVRGALRFCDTCKVWWSAKRKDRRWCPMCHAICVERPLEPATARDPLEVRPGVIAEW